MAKGTKPKPKKCKCCPEKFIPRNSLQTVCSPKCAIQLANQISVASSGLNSVSTMAQGYTASRNSNYNASLLDQQAKTVALQTGSQTAQIRRQGDQALAGQAAAFADNGTGSGGSNALIQRSTAIDTEMDAATADYNGRVQMADLQNQAAAQRAQAKAQRPGLVSLLGGISGAAGSYYNTSAMTKR